MLESYIDHASTRAFLLFWFCYVVFFVFCVCVCVCFFFVFFFFFLISSSFNKPGRFC